MNYSHEPHISGVKRPWVSWTSLINDTNSHDFLSFCPRLAHIYRRIFTVFHRPRVRSFKEREQQFDSPSVYCCVFCCATVGVESALAASCQLCPASSFCSFRLCACCLIKAQSAAITLETVPFSFSHESHEPAGDNDPTRVNIWETNDKAVKRENDTSCYFFVPWENASYSLLTRFPNVMWQSVRHCL